MIRIGTSGFSYKDWVGRFYPVGTVDRDRLRVYAEHFDTVEVNSSYYRIGPPRIYAAMGKKVPDAFEFVDARGIIPPWVGLVNSGPKGKRVVCPGRRAGVPATK